MRWIRAAFSWLVDQAIEHWATIVAVIVGGGGMTYLASISTWLTPFGPVAWGSIGVATILMLSFAFYLFGVARQRISIADYTKAKSAASGTNVLAPVHQDERIELWSFYHPFYQPTENARFENCELFGPAYIAAENCSFLNGGFFDCEIVIVRPDRAVKGAMMFRHCTFVRFKLYRATLVMNYESYKNLPAEVRATVPVISDGRIGDV